MSKGLWGSRFPIDNLLCSGFVFAAVWYRITTRRCYNSIRQALRPRAVRVLNDDTTAIALKHWLDQGYDKLNIGGGRKNLDGFINIDFVSHANVEREVIANILDLAFVPDAIASHIHSNHVIEHLTEAQFRHQLREYYRILQDNGLISIRCPNALGAAYGFWFPAVLEQERDEFVSSGFPRDEDFGNPKDRWAYKDLFGLLHWFYGDMGYIGDQHLNIIIPSKLKAYLEEAGFKVIKMAEPEALNTVVIACKSL